MYPKIQFLKPFVFLINQHWDDGEGLTALDPNLCVICDNPLEKLKKQYPYVKNPKVKGY